MVRDYYKKDIRTIVQVGIVTRAKIGDGITISNWHFDARPPNILHTGWTVFELEEISLMNMAPLNWELLF